ncbi:hypothetical protein C1T17_06135 [Sphingobium sp. SCG-1]|uniref:EamA family transporter n=1 Tax=Sphingobium sp. SCG-1 TaxID=2072936 RepID=UPI000CD6A188|nr:EamA family transporter [Sphingobium sp. SCG-1]AUW57744.1 hypothetical protein C1T17_06135 [Sphingobium sp. SCG-1]
MMRNTVPLWFLPVLLSVLLSAGSQILLKIGVSTPAVQAGMASGVGMDMFRAVATSPMVLIGFASFGLSAVVWLSVLSRLDVSQAYPCVALGILITSLTGHLLLGEALPPMRIAGILTILMGVILTGLS